MEIFRHPSHGCFFERQLDFIFPKTKSACLLKKPPLKKIAFQEYHSQPQDTLAQNIIELNSFLGWKEGSREEDNQK